MNRKTKANLLIAMGLLPLLTTAQGSFAKRTTLLSAIKEIQRRGYHLIVVEKKDNKNRVQFELWTPKWQKKLADFVIYPGWERSVTLFEDKQSDPDNLRRFQRTPDTYRVEGSWIEDHLRGIGKALYFTVLLWVTERNAWLGADALFSVDPSAKRIYKFWKSDPNIESITLTELGYLQGQNKFDQWRFRFLFDTNPRFGGFLTLPQFFDKRLADLGIPSQSEFTTAQYRQIAKELGYHEFLDTVPNIKKIREQLRKDYATYKEEFYGQHEEQLGKKYRNSPIRYLYKLKPGTYPEERELVQSMLEELPKADWYEISRSLRDRRRARVRNARIIHDRSVRKRATK